MIISWKFHSFLKLYFFIGIPLYLVLWVWSNFRLSNRSSDTKVVSEVPKDDKINSVIDEKTNMLMIVIFSILFIILSVFGLFLYRQRNKVNDDVPSSSGQLPSGQLPSFKLPSFKLSKEEEAYWSPGMVALAMEVYNKQRAIEDVAPQRRENESGNIISSIITALPKQRSIWRLPWRMIKVSSFTLLRQERSTVT